MIRFVKLLEKFFVEIRMIHVQNYNYKTFGEADCSRCKQKPNFF